MTVRVLHIFSRMDRGGAEMRTVEVMKNLDGSQFQLDFCALSGKPGQLDTTIQGLGGTVHHLKLGLGFPFAFLRLLRNHHYDVVHSHVLYVSGLMILLARIAKVPVRVAHFRTTGGSVRTSQTRKWRDKLLRQLISMFSTDILAVSQGAMDACWTRYRVRDYRCKVIYNGIDLAGFTPMALEDKTALRSLWGIPRDTPLYLHVGRFSPAKNHRRLVQIFSHLYHQDNDSILLLVGGGDRNLRDDVEQLVSELGLRNNVNFLGLRDDVPQLMQISDVMIFPSKWEGLPGAVLEAMAAGLPVVASDLEGVIEIASGFSAVHPMSLSASDEEWAACARMNLVARSTDDFESSPFTMDRAVDMLCLIWKGSRS